MDDQTREQTEREHALPEHETRENDERTSGTTADIGSTEIDEAAIDPRDESGGPPPITRSG